MREVAFIKQNKQKWLEFEQLIFGTAIANPDDTADLYIQIINDLSYAQTYYPKSKTTAYLNYLAVHSYQQIYKTKRTESNRIAYFFKTEVPLLVYEHRSYLVFTLVLFLCITSLGAVSAHYDDSFIRLILGDSYVNQTLENIKNGDPMSVYQSGSNWGSFIGITFNNLYVGLRLFLYGLFGGLGTLLFLLYNCIMLGSFQYLFIKEGVFQSSFLGIWLHGAFEISALVVEAFAGFVLGGSLLFPKTYSRIQSLKRGFKNGLKIFISTVPFTLAAGFIEGYITRYAQAMPQLLNYLIIFGSFAVILFYYGIYPKLVYHKSLA